MDTSPLTEPVADAADLRVRMVQTASGLDPADNRARLEGLVGGPGADLVVLPEAFARDFGRSGSDVSAFAEQVEGPFGSELSRVATAARSTVVAGMFERSGDPERPHNTLLVRGGARAEYRKIHLYDSFGYRESDRLTGGEIEPVVVDVGGWRIGLATCYDLRFPELFRRLVDAGAEVFCVPAAWLPGDGKVMHWTTLLRARAIENTAYAIGVGQPEPRYSGHSVAYSPLGEEMAALGGAEGVAEVVLSRSQLTKARRTNPSLDNRRL